MIEVASWWLAAPGREENSEYQARSAHRESLDRPGDCIEVIMMSRAHAVERGTASLRFTRAGQVGSTHASVVPSL